MPGGIGNHTFHLANELYDNHRRVIVLTEERYNTHKEWRQFCDSVNFTIVGISRNKLIFYTYLKRIFYFFYLSIKLQPVTFFSGKFSIWLAAFNPSKKRSFAIVHGSEIKCGGIFKFIFHRGLQKVNNIISVSNFTNKILIENYVLNNEKCVVINNGFNFDNKEFQGYKKIKSTLKFITIGGMHRRKGQHNFICALPQLISEFGEILYTIAGLPKEIDRLKELAIHLNVINNVRFIISPSNHELVQLLNDSDIFIMLSENLENGDFEGFGIAILEAMSLGLPAIGSKNSGIEDAISNHYSGVLVNHSNIEEIKNAVNDIQLNYQKYSINAIEWSKKFRWKNVIEHYEYLLK
jgi:glycosyltransferase involved in cell wall biosynthesis